MGNPNLNENQSEKGTLNKEDYKQLLIKAVMASVAAGLPVLADQLRLVDFGQYQPLVTVGIFMLAYLGQRLAQGK